MNVQKSFDHTIYYLNSPEWLSTDKGKCGSAAAGNHAGLSKETCMVTYLIVFIYRRTSR